MRARDGFERALMWMRAIVFRRRFEREMREEMAQHLERSTMRLTARGLEAEDARREAMREFGNIAWLQEEARYARGVVWLDAMKADLRFATRHFARTPWTTMAILVVLVVGMSVSTLLFAGIHSYAFAPPPGIERDGDLVRIRGSRLIDNACCVTRAFAPAEFDAYRGLTNHFAAVAGWTGADVVLRVGDNVPVRARGVFVTDNYFSVLGIQPQHGPGLPDASVSETISETSVVIGHAVWLHHFGRDPDVSGSSITVNGRLVTVAGVAPESFRGLPDPGTLHVWLPLALLRQVVPDAAGSVSAVARLRSGVDENAATVAVQVVASRTAENAEERASLGPSSRVVPLLASNYYAGFEEETGFLSIAVALLAFLVLLIVCTNASTLLTGLATARRHEIAVRLSLGAGRRRLLRQLLTESALIACAAALCALVVVWTILRLVTVFIPFLGFVPRVSWPVTAFTFGVALSVGVLFGLAPALHATRLAVAGVLRDSSATVAAVRARLQRGLVVAQIALTQPLMVLLAAVLFVLADVQPDRRSDSSDRVIVTGDIAPALATGMTLAVGADQASDLVQRLAVRMEAIPGVQSVSIGRGGASRIGTYFVGAERPAEPRAGVRVAATPADPRHFEVMGLSLVRGRSFNDEDAASAAESPIIVGDDVARELWGDTDAVGRRLEAISDTASVRTLVVVGVVDVAGSQADASDIRVYVPADTSRPAVSLLIRTAGLAGPLIPTVRGIIDKEAPATEVALHTLAQVEALRARPFRMLANGVSAAGVMALFISAIGLYAVIAFAVGQRTREIAIRIAVGGRREQLVRRFVADGLRLCAFGLVLGLPVSLAGLQVLIVILRFPWPVPMPPIIATAILGITIVASAAVWIPARNAASVDPALTLRRE